MKDIFENSEAYVEVLKYVAKGECDDTNSKGTYYCTNEDLENFRGALEKQIVKELRVWANGTEHCSNCDHNLSYRDSADTHCSRCGQRFKEVQRLNKGDKND